MFQSLIVLNNSNQSRLVVDVSETAASRHQLHHLLLSITENSGHQPAIDIRLVNTALCSFNAIKSV